MKIREIFQELCDHATHVFKNFDKFLKSKCNEDQTFQYFNNYCGMVEILLDSNKADREGNFDLHLTSTKKMLPYFFSLNHPLYARGVSMSLQDMLQLSDSVKLT